MLTEDIKKSIDKSVLCWLATSNQAGEPNVSPKEIFIAYDDSTLLVANIASPNSARNIKANPHVCVSFVDIFVQKGYQLKGKAKIIDTTDSSYHEKRQLLTDAFTDKFPIPSIIEIKITTAHPIIAPSYRFYPETTEESQVEDAMKTYGVQPIERN